jgi:hypothetical protein
MEHQNNHSSSTRPFKKAHELCNKDNSSQLAGSLLGYPQISLDDTTELWYFIQKDICAPTLEALSPRLWWMSKQSSAHIWPLHYQAIKLRNIVVSGNPELHLVWYYDRIFIKPLPKYLLSLDFWDSYLKSQPPLSGPEHEIIKYSALGLLRSYRYLVQHESDFCIAQEKHLIPSTATWESFSLFLLDLRWINDKDVTCRYTFGEIRLSRLNFYIKFILWRSTFHKIDGQYGAYFARFYGPFLFIFGILSVFLSALQVGMAVESVTSNICYRFWSFARWTSIIVTVVIALIACSLLIILIIKISAEWYFAFSDRKRRRIAGAICAQL